MPLSWKYKLAYGQCEQQDRYFMLPSSIRFCSGMNYIKLISPLLDDSWKVNEVCSTARVRTALMMCWEHWGKIIEQESNTGSAGYVIGDSCRVICQGW